MRWFVLIAWLFSILPGASAAQTRALNDAAFQDWIAEELHPRARAAGISDAVFQLAMQGVRLQADLPGLAAQGAPKDQQAEFRAPSAYFREDVLQRTAEEGRDQARQHAQALRNAAEKTGVPAHILLGIWGRESAFGRAAIPHDAIAVLATKAYAGNRSGYFQQELLAAMKILQSDRAPRGQMRSSWAGAMGQPQFMPSSYLKYGADGDGDGRVDIWGSVPDTLMSIGTYLARQGWQAGRDWGFEVIVPKSVPCTLEGPENGRPIRDWQALGVVRVNGKSFPDHELAGSGHLVLPAGRYGPAFLVTPNFFVLKRYNNSDVYALFVGHSADRIAYGMAPFVTPWRKVGDVTRAQVSALQSALVSQGHDVGGVDGLIGTKTRRAIGLWQAENGLAQSCYPDQAVVRRLAR